MRLCLILSFLLTGCGIKASLPRPPLDEPTPASPAPAVAEPKDAGCCGEAK